MSAEKNIWKDAIMGVVVGDALGCPVQFVDRAELAKGPVDDMEGYGTYNMPEGTWTDDSSMTIATLISIQENGGINLPDIMYRFVLWLTKGEYTPFGKSFDIGGGTLAAITRYIKNPDVKTCGGTTAQDNGNGSLMRIMPVCLYCYEEKKKGTMTDAEAVCHIHEVSGLTHNHLRAKIACGLYYFLVTAVLDEKGSLAERLQKGIDAGFAFYKEAYKGDEGKLRQLYFYNRLRNLDTLAKAPESSIRSSGYVVDTIEASVWVLITTESFKDALLKAVNLGDDTDTIGAIAGGLAGLYYGYDAIPEEWLSVIKRREWVEELMEGRNI